VESKPVCRIPEFVPLAARPRPGSASRTTAFTPRRASACATAHPTTPPPMITTSVSALPIASELGRCDDEPSAIGAPTQPRVECHETAVQRLGERQVLSGIGPRSYGDEAVTGL
jgi:hypothetical protein